MVNVSIIDLHPAVVCTSMELLAVSVAADCICFWQVMNSHALSSTNLK